MKPEQLIGKRFNKLVVVGVSTRTTTGGNYYVLCKCDCGNTSETLPSNLRRKKGGTTSCGCIRKSRILEKGGSNLNRLIFDYKGHSKKLGVSFDLTRPQIEQITKRDCYYCGIKPKQIKTTKDPSNGDYIYNGIDRLNPKKGYTIVNSVPCCKICNYMKRNMTELEFMRHCRKVVAICSVSSVV